MATTLVIIEAPGKRKHMANVLWQAGMRDVEVMATVGHIGTNPERFHPLGVDTDYNETAYRLKPDKEKLAMNIEQAAKAAKKIYIATDDDQEGDVIARDVLRFCIDEEDHHKVLRLRLKALVPSEVQVAVAEAAPFEPLAAARGDARRVMDRIIGAMSTSDGAVGRVQGSTLLCLQSQVPVQGVMTFTLKSNDDRGDWVAKYPVYAGQDTLFDGELDYCASPGRSEMATMARRAMNHDDIVLQASLATGGSIGQVSRAMQSLYEKGKMTYPRSRDHSITADSFRRVAAIARANGAGFDMQRFRAIRELNGAHAHEAPNSMMLDVGVNKSLETLELEDQVLVLITRHLIDCGIPCQYETPRLMDLTELPGNMAQLGWHRIIPTGDRLWESKPAEAGYTAWTAEQSLLHFMMKNELGRPSTIINHIDKFLGRDLIDEHFELTKKGAEWSANIGVIFNHQNISKMIENYIEENCKEPNRMVAEMIELCQLHSVGSSVQNQERNYDEESLYTGDIY